MKTIAVIMPVYNYSRFLNEALESVFSQTRIPDEVIVVDDCSTDNPKDICDKYPQVIYIKHDKNRGLAAARNTGIRASKSQFVFSFDADDILRPQAVEKHLELADDNTIVTCGLMAFGSETYTARPRVATVEILLQTNCIYSNSLFQKKGWELVGGFDESETMRLGWEDRDFFLRLLGAGYKSVIGDYIALLWRRHPSTMSSTSADPNHVVLQNYIYEKNKHLLEKEKEKKG